MASVPEFDSPAVAALGQRLADNVSRAVKVPEGALRHIIVALFAEGHVLIEDYPGVGKTALARALARSIDAEYARVQCTADLLPADVVGTNVFNQRENRFEFRPGPIFANVVLVDEVNRASPKTQSGLLECMQERHVTVDVRLARARAPVHGHRHPEPDRVRGHLPAARGAARPLHGAAAARLSLGQRRGRDARRARQERPGARPRAGDRRGRGAGRPGGGRRGARQRRAAALRGGCARAHARGRSHRARCQPARRPDAAQGRQGPGGARWSRPRAPRRRPGAGAHRAHPPAAARA